MKKNKKDVNIVIVEDDKYFNKVLTKYVETICDEKVYSDFNFNIKSYHTAENTIQELEDDTDIMLLDYYLEHENEVDLLTGADVLDEVTKHCDECKVVMISAQEEKGLTEELKNKGISAYIDKNINSKNRVGAVLQDLLKDM